MPILASEALFYKNKKIQLQNATLVCIEPLDLWFQVQHAPLYTNLAFACKTETLSSLYSHALLILTKSSKSKHQVVHEQKFKDLLSSICQVSVERSMLDLESEVQWFSTHWGNILIVDIFCFHIVKPLMSILALLPISFNYEKPRLYSSVIRIIKRISTECDERPNEFKRRRTFACEVLLVKNLEKWLSLGNGIEVKIDCCANRVPYTCNSKQEGISVKCQSPVCRQSMLHSEQV